MRSIWGRPNSSDISRYQAAGKRYLHGFQLFRLSNRVFAQFLPGLCASGRDTKTLELKKAGRRHAETIGNSALVDQFAVQVSELTRNIESQRQDYLLILSNLKDSDRSLVEAEFDDQIKGAGAVTTDPLYVQAVRASYEKQLRGDNPLSQDCLVDAR